MAGTNKNLNKALRAKKDEFYTQFDDIANELRHYQQHFAGKTVLCNCDDPYESNFTKYFLLKFNKLGLKRLLCVRYYGSPIANRELAMFGTIDPETTNTDKEEERKKMAYVIEVKADDFTSDPITNEGIRKFLDEHPVTPLKEGKGSFLSKECIALLKEADIVVTNPPFSLWREYVAQLMEYNKKFLIIGNQNAITYKDIFPLIKDNKMWLGYGFNAGNAYFSTPDTSKYGSGVLMENGLVKFRNICWFTNLDHNKRHEKLDNLCKRYSPEEYPKYDNYDAIEVDRVINIPIDYAGVMGVPITFLDKYCPSQFELLGMSEKSKNNEQYYIPNQAKYDRPYLNGKRKYPCLLIRHKHPEL